MTCWTLYACFYAGKRSMYVILKYASDVANRCPVSRTDQSNEVIPEQNLINETIHDIETKCRKLSDLRKQRKVSVF